MSLMDTFRGFELAGWSDDAVCEKYHEHFGSVTIQSAAVLLDAAQVQRGSRVLDVCCGAGYAAALAGERGAEVVGVDFAQSQIDLAQKVYPGVTFEVGDATELRFDDQTFDCVVNGIGMPHLEDPDAAIAEAFRVLRGGGRFAFSVYAGPERAVGFGLIYSAVQEHGSMDIGLPQGPNFFTFSDQEESRRRLLEAGFQDFRCDLTAQIWRLSSVEEFLVAVKRGSVRAAATLNAQERSAARKIEASIAEGLKRYRAGDGYEVPMPAVVTSASRPRA